MNKELTCVEDLFEIISKNQKFVRFLKEERVFKAYNRLIRMQKLRPYHEQTLKVYREDFKTGQYFIVRAFPWSDKDVQKTKINWPLLDDKWRKMC